MIVTVFRTRPAPDLDPETEREYAALAPQMMQLATAMPGFISAKNYTGEDGEHLAVIEFADESSLEAWATHPRHMAAKQLGREKFLGDYRIQVCKVIRTSVKAAA
ncbi:MAG TPA: antibiotic biosynthesis monooxygenase [Burkholderiales bacterium]|jgi:heme-degrading monooxygenase HmoA